MTPSFANQDLAKANPDSVFAGPVYVACAGESRYGYVVRDRQQPKWQLLDKLDPRGLLLAAESAESDNEAVFALLDQFVEAGLLEQRDCPQEGGAVKDEDSAFYLDEIRCEKCGGPVKDLDEEDFRD